MLRNSLVKYVTVVIIDSQYILFWFKMDKSLFSIKEDIYFGAVTSLQKEVNTHLLNIIFKLKIN